MIPRIGTVTKGFVVTGLRPRLVMPEYDLHIFSSNERRPGAPLPCLLLRSCHRAALVQAAPTRVSTLDRSSTWLPLDFHQHRPPLPATTAQKTSCSARELPRQPPRHPHFPPAPDSTWQGSCNSTAAWATDANQSTVLQNYRTQRTKKT